MILPSIRVLAIDQAPKEKDGQNAVVGKTATLELKPEQIPVLTAARQAGSLSLALRSITDAKAVESNPLEEAAPRNVGLNVVRYGIASRATAQK
jgi:pilus assembly protein CpaB